jgi:hypothetical protein
MTPKAVLSSQIDFLLDLLRRYQPRFRTSAHRINPSEPATNHQRPIAVPNTGPFPIAVCAHVRFRMWLSLFIHNLGKNGVRSTQIHSQIHKGSATKLLLRREIHIPRF